MLPLLLCLRAAYACVASKDPEELVPVTTAMTTTTTTTTATTTTTTTTPVPPPPPCVLCPRPLYRNNCNGETNRTPCPTAAAARVITTSGSTSCTMRFTCPADTQAYVWTPGRVNPLAFGGSTLTCGSGHKWRTDMGLLVSDVSCMRPAVPAGCAFCPTAAQMYQDCTPYGRTLCSTLPQISADIQRTASNCQFTIICAPGETMNIFTSPTAPPDDTSTSFQQLTCPLPPGAPQWLSPTGPAVGFTCMSMY